MDPPSQEIINGGPPGLYDLRADDLSSPENTNE